MTSLKLLAISFAYPPAASPRAIQVARLLKHLRTSTTLICAAYEDKDRIDQTLVQEVEAPPLRCIRVPLIRGGFDSLISRIAYRFDLPIIDKLPDQFRSWKPAVLAAVDQLVQQTDYAPDMIVTFGSPMSDHLIGLALKKRFNVPWLAHFSDPWADNPFLRYDSLTKRLNRDLERRVLRTADRLIFTSEETVKLVTSTHPSEVNEKARVLPHAYEPEAFHNASPRTESSTLVVRHLGDLYEPRTPRPLFAAVKRLFELEPDTLSGVKFELIGSQGYGHIEEAGSLPSDLVVKREPVRYLESLRLMSEANGLLVIDAPAETSVFLPSKLIDYVGAARPILGITPPGTSASLLERLGGWIANPSDTGAVAETLKRFISFLRNNADSDLPWGDAKTRKSFEAANVSEQFSEILLDVRR